MAPATLSRTEQTNTVHLTREDIRIEVENALKDFKVELGTVVSRALLDAQAVAAGQKPPERIDGLENSGDKLGAGNTTFSSIMRKEMHAALDEWWAQNHFQIALTGLDAAHRDCRSSPLNNGNHRSNSATTASFTEGSSPPMTPAEDFVLPPLMRQTSGETLMATPNASPLLGPASMPTTPLQGPCSTPPLHAMSRRDWRQRFVERAFKVNRKIEFLPGYNCLEVAEVQEVMEEAARALEDGVAPFLVEDGMGGTYFMKDVSGHSIAVFKPRDEEPLAPNNPKDNAGAGGSLKEGLMAGYAAISEFAAFLVDQSSPAGLRAGVCPTGLVCVKSSVFHSMKESRNSPFRVVKDKVGSFQLFAKHDGTSEDYSPNRYSDDQVHRLAVLDIRMCNADRHSGNILVRSNENGRPTLIPIDHGYTLPSKVGEATFEWLDWPAAKRPFSKAMKQEILDLEPGLIEKWLKRKVPALRPEQLSTLRICTVLLQCGVREGLTASEIGHLMVRPEEDNFSGDEDDIQPSILEEMIKEAHRELETNRGKYEDGDEEPFETCLGVLFTAKCQERVEARKMADTDSD